MGGSRIDLFCKDRQGNVGDERCPNSLALADDDMLDLCYGENVPS